MAREFDELSLDEHNYPTWALDVKIRLAFCEIMVRLAFCEIMATPTPPAEREASFFGYIQVPDTIHHLEPPPPQLKVGICDEGGASQSLGGMKSCYEQRETILLPEVNHEWTQIHLQDFKFIEDYNHTIHKICAKLRFCEKESSKEDKIEKTLQNMLPSDRVL
jgi:hypothetical protein